MDFRFQTTVRVRWLIAFAGICIGATGSRLDAQEAGQGAELLVAPFSEWNVRRAQEAWTKHLKTKVEITNSIGMKLRLIPAGEFQMGSPSSEKERSNDETQHVVKITKPFFIAACEVTQAEYQKMMESNPSDFSSDGDQKDKVSGQKTGRFPVEHVTWYDAIAFCNKLSETENLSPYYRMLNVDRKKDDSIQKADVSIDGGSGYRLPTEAEWEYACRAGTTLPFHFSSESNGHHANVNGNSPYGTKETGPALKCTTSVGSYRPNAFGLFDMHGNVSEWCWDFYDKHFYEKSPVSDPKGPSSGDERVTRGGSAFDNARSAARRGVSPTEDRGVTGFRLAKDL